MVTEDYVSFETAKLLKDKGFDEPCRAYWHEDEKRLIISQSVCTLRNITNPCFFGNTAPTLQMAMKWPREVHNIDIFPWKISKDIYSCAIINSNTGRDLSSDKDFPSEKYEQACEAAIKYCLENLI